jgi:MFS-type transporter involved in bile tolerance (Atg22 family)
MGFAYMSSHDSQPSLIPQSENANYFGLYVFAERFSSISGPAVWGILVWVFGSHMPLNYRIAAFGMAMLVCIGIMPLIRRGR